jgi:hypothetical protein
MATQSKSQDNAVIKLDVKAEKRVGESLTTLALRRLRRDKLTLIALAVILLMGLMSIFAPVIARDILHVDYSRTNISEAFLTIGSPGISWGATTWAGITWRDCCTPGRCR